MLLLLFSLVLIVVGVVSASSSQQAKNVAVVKQLYVDFATGNLAGFLEPFAPEYSWVEASAAQANFIFASYNNNAMEFFELFGKQVNFTYTEITFTSSEDQVIALYTPTQVCYLTGKTIRAPNTDIYTFNSKGQITSLLTIGDTAAEIDFLTLGQTPYSLMQLVTEMTQLVNAHDSSFYDKYYTPDCIIVNNPGGNKNITAAKAGFEAFLASFPDFKFTITNLVANNNDIVVQVTITGTFTGAPYNGFPPTGKPVSFTESIIKTIVNGKVTAEIEIIDLYTLLSQIGAFSGR